MTSERHGEHAESATSVRATWTRLVLLAVTAAILLVTASPSEGRSNPRPWWQVLDSPGDLADVLLNVVLFVPFGLALAWVGARRARSLALALALSLVIELLQLFVVPGRQASVSDLLANTVGALAGHAVATPLSAALLADPRLARRLALAWGMALSASIVAGSWLLQPALPGSAPPAECGRSRVRPRCFHGDYVTRPVLRQPGSPDLELRPGVAVGVGRTASLAAEIVPYLAARRPEQIAALGTARGGDLLAIQVRVHWVILHVRTRGAELGLRSPAISIPHAFHWGSTRYEVEGGVTGNRQWLRVGEKQATLVPSSADTWRLLWPWALLSGRAIAILGPAFHLLLLAPLGYWAGRARHGPAWTIAAVTAPVVVGFVGGALLAGLAPAPPAAWLGGGAGAVAGLLAGRVTCASARPRRD